jgi:signal transduction histidine kinase
MGELIYHLTFLLAVLLTLSLFNALLLLWLGLTVLLNSERRTWGVMLVGCGLLVGGVFFISHAPLVQQSALANRPDFTMWWRLGWTGLIFAPFAWYIGMLWHAGYWQERASAIRTRHRPLLVVAALLAISMAVVFVISNPIPSRIQLSGMYFVTDPALFGIPLLALLYPVYVLACVVFSLGALLRPGPASRAMSAPARLRARPWLVSASLALLLVSILMIDAMVFLVLYGGGHSIMIMEDQPVIEAHWLDLAVSLPITAAIVLLGQAIVAYEIFTGRTLPRRGLQRQWHAALVVATGYSIIVGASLAIDMNPIYTVLLATVCVAVTYALFGWRSFADRQRHMDQLRSLVSSEHVYDAVLRTEGDETPQVAGPFTTFCRDVLGVQSAILVPSGVLSSFVERPIAYPTGAAFTVDVDDILAKCTSPEVMSVSLDPDRSDGATWAVPLWSARGLTGLLVLGPKAEGGLYSHEDIETARASGERLLDTVAVVNLAQRLMALQRQRFVETQVLDQQSRRTLHDDILPSLHAAILQLSSAPVEAENTAEALKQLAEVHRRASELLREMPAGRASRVEELGLLGALRDMVETEFSHDFDEVAWIVDPRAEERARSLPALTGDVVYYAAKEVIRNSARHGRGDERDRPLRLEVGAAWSEGLDLHISDNGVGVAAATDEQIGAGQGLALHSAMLAVIGGSLLKESKPDAGAAVTLFLPEELWEKG